ncbi:MAG: hypothetical protein ABJQ90_13750, partial [Parasphingorhabdus sp.]
MLSALGTHVDTAAAQCHINHHHRLPSQNPYKTSQIVGLLLADPYKQSHVGPVALKLNRAERARLLSIRS